MFQVTAGLANAKSKLIVADCIGKPIKKKNIAEVNYFKWNSNFDIHTCNRCNFFKNKLFNFLLRRALENRNTGMLFITARFIAIVSFSIHFRHLVLPYISVNLGLDDKVSQSSCNLFIGYHQTYIFPDKSHVNEIVKNISPKNYNYLFERLKLTAEHQRILCVHVRLGDYRVESSFGVLPQSYYFQAIEWMQSKFEFEKIWVFSDEPNAALDFIPKKFHKVAKILPEIGDSSVYTMELMRYCKGYVIGNSTFSWWGAYLSKTPESPVVSPKTWFNSVAEPRYLIPSHWRRM